MAWSKTEKKVVWWSLCVPHTVFATLCVCHTMCVPHNVFHAVCATLCVCHTMCVPRCVCHTVCSTMCVPRCVCATRCLLIVRRVGGLARRLPAGKLPACTTLELPWVWPTKHRLAMRPPAGRGVYSFLEEYDHTSGLEHAVPSFLPSADPRHRPASRRQGQRGKPDFRWS